MTDRKAQDVNEVAKRFAETLADSYRLVFGQAAEAGPASFPTVPMASSTPYSPTFG